MSDSETDKRELTVIIERDSAGYYVANVPELRGCHTQAKYFDVLIKRIRKAIDLCLEEQGIDCQSYSLLCKGVMICNLSLNFSPVNKKLKLPKKH